MAAFKVNLKLDQGATNRKLVTWKAGEPAVAVDLTGSTAKAQVRATITSEEVLVELTTENGGIVLGGVAGTVEMIFSPVHTVGVTWRAAVYDLEIITGTEVRRLLQGTITLSPEVTRG